MNKVKVSSYIAQYPILRIAQSALHFISMADLFNQTPSQLLWEASSHMIQLIRESCSYTYLAITTARYSCIQLSELEQCRVKTFAQRFNIAGQDSNPGSLGRQSEALPLSNWKAWKLQKHMNTIYSTGSIVFNSMPFLDAMFTRKEDGSVKFNRVQEEEVH